MVELLDSCRGVNDRRGCGRRVEHGTQFCQHHVCQIHNCQAPRTRSSDFCIDHGCPAVGCHQPRQTHPQEWLRGDAEEVFCGEHACSYGGCRNQNAEDSNRCLRHGGGGMSRLRPGVNPEDERPARVLRGDVGDSNGYRRNGRDGQRQLGWAEVSRRDPWAAWGMAM
jgi:hypothetical protein